jgi:hypothetical protein
LLPFTQPPLTATENAFTAGMLTGQQLQHAATLGNPVGRLGTLVEGKQQQHQEAIDGLHQHPPLPTRRMYSSPAVVSDSSGSAGAAAGGTAAEGSRASRLLRRLPGGDRMVDWVSNARRDSWRKQQEQLQKDRFDINQVRWAVGHLFFLMNCPALSLAPLGMHTC